MEYATPLMTPIAGGEKDKNKKQSIMISEGQEIYMHNDVGLGDFYKIKQ